MHQRLLLAWLALAIGVDRSYAQTLPADTAWPTVPRGLYLPRDSTHTVSGSNCAGERYYTNLLGVAFKTSTSGPELRHLLRRYRATIVGGVPAEGPRGAYQIRLPTPAHSLQGLDSVRNEIGHDPHIQYVFPIPWHGCFDPGS